MTHVTVDQLLELREPGREPGAEAARAHLERCPACRSEADRLAQRIARLRALPAPRPSRDRFPAVRSRWLAERRGRRLRAAGWTVLALAASAALVAGLGLRLSGDRAAPGAEGGGDEMAAFIARSQQLEAALREYDPDSRPLDGRTAGITLQLEEQVGAVDRQLEGLGLMRLDRDLLRREQLRLWRERVGLLDALMDVHLTRATFAGL